MPGDTSLHPVTSKLVRDEWTKLRHEKIEPWFFMEVGDGLHVTDFHGRTIRYRGIRYAGSVPAIFWGRYIDPFLEDIVLRILDRTVALCRDEGHDHITALPESAHLLKGLVRSAFATMADVERRLLAQQRTAAAPHDTAVDVQRMDEFIDARVAGLLQVLAPSQTRLQRWRHRAENHKLGAAFLFLAAVLAGAAAISGSVSALVSAIQQVLRL